jgi:hypothetical protein
VASSGFVLGLMTAGLWGWSKARVESHEKASGEPFGEQYLASCKAYCAPEEPAQVMTANELAQRDHLIGRCSKVCFDSMLLLGSVISGEQVVPAASGAFKFKTSGRQLVLPLPEERNP